MDPVFLNQCQLAKRWNMSHRTLERWRWTKQGPGYVKIGRRVGYRLTDIEAFEAEHFQDVSATARDGKRA